MDNDIITRLMAEDAGASATIDAVKANFQQYIDEVVAGTPAEEAFAAASARASEAMLQQAAAAGAAGGAAVENAAAMDASAAATRGATVATNDAEVAYARLHAGLLSTGMAVSASTLGIIGLAAAALAGAAAIKAIAQAEVEWQQQMVLLQNNTASTDATIQQMSRDILHVGAQMGANFDNMAQGARRILDYSFSAADATKILNQATQVAVATGANEADVSQALAQALHQYGASANEAATFTNVLLNSSQMANTTMQQFAENTKTATGVASAVGVPYEQVTAALSALTRQYGDASKAQTQVVNIMSNLLHPSQQQAAAWDALSQATGDANVKSDQLAHTLSTEGLSGILTHLTQDYQKLGFSQEQAEQYTLSLISRQRGGLGLVMLLTSANDDYNAVLKRNQQVLDGELNPAQDAFNREADTTANKLARVGDVFGSLAKEGSILSDIIGGLSDKFLELYHNGEKGADMWMGFIMNTTGAKDTLNQLGQELGAKGVDAVNNFKDVLAKGGKDAAQQFRDNIAAEWSTLPTEAQQSMQPFLGIMDQYLKQGVTDATAAGQDISDALNIQEQAAQDAKNASAAYALYSKEGYAQAVADTQQKMSELQQALDIEKEAAAEATKAGNTHAANLHNELAAELEQTYKDMQDQLTILNDFSKAAGQAGYNAGNAWATNYLSQLNAALAQTSRGGGQTYSPAAPTGPTNYQPPNPYVLPTNPTPPMTDAQAAQMEQSIYAANQAKKRGGGGPSAAQTGSTLAQAQQTYELELEQLKLKMQLLAATNDLKAATAEKTAVDQSFDATLKQINADLLKNQQAEAGDAALNKAKLNANIVEQEAAQSAANDAASANKLAVEIHNVTDRLKELQREADSAMAPLKARLDADTQAMDELTKATEAQDLAFQHETEAIDEQEYALEQREKQIMGPLNAAVDAATATEQKYQDELNNITRKYENELFPIEQALTKIENERAAIQMGDKMEQEGNAIANLTARLKDQNLTQQERASIEMQLAKARRDLGLDQHEAFLKGEEAAIKAKEAAEQHAEEQKIARQEKIVAAAKAAAEAQQKAFDQEKQNLDEQKQNIEHQQKLYDEQQRDKKVAAQAQIDADNAAIKAQQELSDARSKADKAYLEELQNEQQEQQFTAQQNAYNWGLAVQAAKDAVANLEGPYKANEDSLKAQADSVKAQKDAWDNYTQPIIDHLTDIKNADQGVLDTFNNNKELVQTVQKYWDAQTKANNALDKTKEGAPIVAKAIKDLADASTLAYTPTVDLARSLGIDTTSGLTGAIGNVTTALTGASGLKGAVDGLAGATTPGLQNTANVFGKFFGGPSDANFDPSVSIEWMLDTHNTEGFWGRIFYQWRAAFGETGLQKILHDSLVTLGDHIKPDLNTFASIFTDAGTQAAQNFSDGFVAGINSKMANITLHVTADGGGGGSSNNPPGTPPPPPPPPPPPLGSHAVVPPGQFGSFAVPATHFGGVHNYGDTNISLAFPNVTKLPTDVHAWLPVMKSLEAAMRIYDRFQ